METLAIALGIGLLLAGGAVVWLLVERSRLAVLAATAGAERDAAGAAREQAEAAAAGLRALLAETESRLGAAEKQLGAMEARLTAEVAARVADVKQADERLERALEAERSLSGARLEAAQQTLVEVKRQVEQSQVALRDAFKTLAGEALQSSTAEFLKLAEQKLGGAITEGEAKVKAQRVAVESLVQPMSKTLKETEEKLAALGALTVSMGQSNEALRTQTEQLVRALREPKVRGRYGEVQLKRVAEIAGMKSYCDFVEQDSTRDAEGNALRPDMIVRLPNGRDVVVDAKANLQPYIEAIEAHGDAARQEACMERFAAGIEKQARALGAKDYWSQYQGSPEFVVMFVPGDQFVDAALERRPDLIRTAAESKVILASPSTLIALLQAVHVAFRERDVAVNAQALLELGKELHQRLAVAMGHVESLGKAIAQAGAHYDRFVGSYDKRLLPQFRRMEEFSVSSGQAMPELEPLHVTVRSLPGAPAGAGDEVASDAGAASPGG